MAACVPPLGNLFCTYGSFWRLFCTYTSPCLAYSLQVPRLHSYSYTSDFCGLFCFLLQKTYHIMIVHIPQVMYSVHIPLVTYSVHRPSHGDLFCTKETFLYPTYFYGLFCIFTSPWWAYLYLGNILWQRARPSGDLFCTHAHTMKTYILVTFMAYFIYFFLVCLSSPILWLSSADLFWTHTFISVTYSVHMDVYQG